MQYTPNYNLIIAEGTDAVNPLTQIFPNFSTIDGAMDNNKKAGITTASEVTTGGVHAIVRVDTNVPVFRFTATSAWTTGDTMTLDGSAVTVHLADGTAPKSGSYVIGAEVLAVVNGSLVTLMTGASFDGVVSFNSRQGVVIPQSGDYTANMIGYNNTLSGLSSTNAQDAVDELSVMSKHGVYEIWTNPNPSADFAGQNVTFSSSLDIDTFLVESSGGELYSIEATDSTSVAFTKTAIRTNNGQIRYIVRRLTIGKSGDNYTLTFDNATIYDLVTYGTPPTGVTNNGNVVPLRIFGIIHNS